MIVQSCLVLSRDGNAGEVWLLQKKHENSMEYSQISLIIFFLIVRKTTDQWSLESSKAVVSPHKTWQCIFPSFGMIPRERDILFGDDTKMFPSTCSCLDHSHKEEVGGELALSLVLWLPLINATEV